jgi:hypothetical protein
VKEFLSRAGRPFLVKNVDEDLDAYNDLIARGFRAVPVTLIAGTAIKGFDEAALQAALEALPS